MTKSYEETSLWRNAFRKTGDATKDEIATALSVKYGAMWERACSVAARIAAEVPGLTLHDERHFERLWECASLVSGSDYTLSPIEAFVFGASVLIHDSAHTVLAFEGGLESIEKTKEWSDAVAYHENDDSSSEPLSKRQEISDATRKAALFDTLRLIHAEQAKTMLGRSFRHPSFQDEYFLLEDITLRSHFGELVGKIAASHNWDLASLLQLGRQKNPISPYHTFGPMRPFVIAALLRVADAVQIDHARATDFEMALTQPSGVSYDHWAAQNRLAVAADAQDSSALLVTSSSPFQEADVRAWWIAYELARTADRELQDCNRFLRDNDETPFAITRVKDVADPTAFSAHVTPVGWVPANVQIHVSDPQKIVSMFGGRGLYGNDPLVPLRELIQNASDAIRPRRALEAGFSGHVEVSLYEGKGSNGELGFWLEVADDGIGMSTEMLTGPFLSFGESGWSSDALRKEWPGLMGRRIKHVGHFGIGFFSVFMIAKEVLVSSRKYRDGLDQTQTLHFKDGLGLRPILRSGGGGSENMMTTTRVSCFLTSQTAWNILSRNARSSQNGATSVDDAYSLRRLLASLCCATDTNIYTSESGAALELAVGSDWINENSLDWLARIVDDEPNNLPSVVSDNIDLMELIKFQGEVIGRAALNPSSEQLGIRTIGGFGRKRGGFVNISTDRFFGQLAMRPDGPRRDFGPWVNADAATAWADSQVKKWSTVPLESLHKHMLAVRASSFGADPSALIVVLIGDMWLTISDIFKKLVEGTHFLAPIERGPRLDSGRFKIRSTAVELYGLLGFREEDDWRFEANIITSKLSNTYEEFWEIPTDKIPAPNSFLSCLERWALTQGREIIVTLEQRKVAHYSGPDIRRLGLKSDSDQFTICACIAILPKPA